MPHITVTIPVFNRAHLVGRTIESVLKQDFQDYDLLVVDDASTDNTVEVVQSFVNRDSRIRLVINKKNLGLTRNWNRCIELSSGPLVQILQSDDLIDKDYLGKVSLIFDKHPNVGFVSANCRYIDIYDQILSDGVNKSDNLFIAGDEAVTAILRGSPHVSSVVLRTDCYKNLGGFNEDFWFAPDIEMYTRLAVNYDYYRFGSTHTSFRRHGTNSGMLEYLRSDYIKVFLKMNSMAFGYLSKKGLYEFGINDLNRYLSEDAANTALNAALYMISFGRRKLAHYYYLQALQLNRHCWHSKKLWKVLLLYAFGYIGVLIVRRRFNLKKEDLSHIQLVEHKLRSENLLLNP